MAYSTNKESPVFSAHAIGHTPYALLVPAYAQVYFVKTDRKIIGLSGTTANICYNVFRCFGMCERWICERKFRHGIRSVSCSAP